MYFDTLSVLQGNVDLIVHALKESITSFIWDLSVKIFVVLRFFQLSNFSR